MDAVTQGDVGKQIFATLDKAGVVPLAWGENGYREISNSNRPSRAPPTSKGLKIRVVGSPCSWTPSPPWAPTPRR